MDLEQVKQFLQENKEDEQVSNYLKELSAPSQEQIEGYLETDEGKRLLQPKLDRNFTQGLNTWKENNLNKIIEDEVAKRNPEESPEQKRIRELEEKIAQSERAAQTEKLSSKAVSHASEKGLPTNLVSYFIGEDEDSTMNNLSTLEQTFNEAVTKAVDAKFKSNGREVPGGNAEPESVGAQAAKQANQQKETPDAGVWG